MSALAKELETFRRELPRLLQEEGTGHFALIHGDVIAGIYSSFELALSAGYDRFGLDRFLVREITETEKPKYFSRNLRCHS